MHTLFRTSLERVTRPTLALRNMEHGETVFTVPANTCEETLATLLQNNAKESDLELSSLQWERCEHLYPIEHPSKHDTKPVKIRVASSLECIIVSIKKSTAGIKYISASCHRSGEGRPYNIRMGFDLSKPFFDNALDCASALVRKYELGEKYQELTAGRHGQKQWIFTPCYNIANTCPLSPVE